MPSRKFTSKRRHRAYRLRFKIRGTPDRPRLSIFRSARHLYAQVIDDETGRTLVAACTLEKAVAGIDGDKTARATKVGELVVARALDAGVRKLVFDRNGFVYHGRIAAASKAAHAMGLLSREGFTGTWPGPAPQAESVPADGGENHETQE